jgi:hypothetical protein
MTTTTLTSSDCSTPSTYEYALNPDYYEFELQCQKPIGACTETSKYGSCRTLAGVTADDKNWAVVGGGCLGATTKACCGNLLELGVVYCIWYAAHVDDTVSPAAGANRNRANFGTQ